MNRKSHLSPPPGTTLVVLCALLFGSPGSGAAEEWNPEPSPVVLSEIFYNPPPELPFPMGQWVELTNLSDLDVPLAGAQIKVQSAFAVYEHVVPLWEVARIPAGGTFLMGATRALALNAGVEVDYGYGTSVAFPKTGGLIRLTLADGRSDEVVYGPTFTLATPPGVSLNLEPGAYGASDNDLVPHWCPTQWSYVSEWGTLLATPHVTGHECDSDADGFVESDGDCDDDNPSIGPGVQELCNGLDDDCDGAVDEDPLGDQPKWNLEGVCASGGPFCAGFQGWLWDLPEGFEVEEDSCDQLDNDCDGLTDEDLLNLCGYCGPTQPDLCDGLDNDCDGQTDEEAISPPEDLTCTTSNLGVCRDVGRKCQGKWTCVFPETFEEVETLCDGLDNDCDGATDEDYPLGGWCQVGTGACLTEGVYQCAASAVEVECLVEEVVGSVEMCGDNIDNDCDGETDEDFPIGDVCTVGQGACRQTGMYFCAADGLSVACSGDALEAGTELCGNGVDDDCDGTVDEEDCQGDTRASGGCSSLSALPPASPRFYGFLLFVSGLLLYAVPRLFCRVRSR